MKIGNNEVTTNTIASHLTVSWLWSAFMCAIKDLDSLQGGILTRLRNVVYCESLTCSRIKTWFFAIYSWSWNRKGAFLQLSRMLCTNVRLYMFPWVWAQTDAKPVQDADMTAKRGKPTLSRKYLELKVILRFLCWSRCCLWCDLFTLPKPASPSEMKNLWRILV